MYGADLSETDLSGAILSRAILSRAILSEADLGRAILSGAYLGRAYLGRANLHGANLHGADLFGADLSGADLSEAILTQTVFASQDLRTIKGWETITHDGPSRVDFTSVTFPGMTAGLATFLRGVGASDYLIEALKGTILPLQDIPVKVFLSFAEADRDLCQDLRYHLSLLVRSGALVLTHEAVLASEIQIWETKVNAAFAEAHLVVVLMSAPFFSSQQAWKDILEPALQRQQQGTARLVPVILRPVAWQESSLRALQPLPAQGQPVTEWNDRHAAFLDIVTGLRETVQALHAPMMAEAARQREKDLLLAKLIQARTEMAAKRAELEEQHSAAQEAETAAQQAEAALEEARNRMREAQQLLATRNQVHLELQKDLLALEKTCVTLTEQAQAGETVIY
jgi:hypothetical protein